MKITEKLIGISKTLEDIKLDILELRESENIKDNKDRLEELYNDFERLSNKLTEVRVKTAECLVKNTSYTQETETVTILEFIVPRTCNVYFKLINGKQLIILKDSVLCKSNTNELKKLKPVSITDTRRELLGDRIKDTAVINYKTNKLLVTADIDITHLTSYVKEFILGRNLRPSDYKHNIRENKTGRNVDELFTVCSELNKTGD